AGVLTTPAGSGIIGHSEGGGIAPMDAARSSDVAFIVLLAGPGLPGDSVMLLQRAAIDRSEGRAPGRDRVLDLNRRMLTALPDSGRGSARQSLARIARRACARLNLRRTRARRRTCAGGSPPRTESARPVGPESREAA
ncbi:MAG: hypothetical protein IRY91_03915, partial [Gemmatimonadaceae bacterium]|nr:hypothetical protein [Gemmatimonadaceae bacterium]